MGSVNHRMVWFCWGALVIGCAQTRHQALPVESQRLRDRLVVSSDVDLGAQEPLLAELVALREEMSRELQLRDSTEPIYVYLFDEGAKFDAYSRKNYPQLRGRRAFFVEDSAGLSVFARWGDRVVEDLRHELTHGYLHAVAQVPLWLDEGIAEYYEVASDEEGLNWQHVDQLVAARRSHQWEPDLSRLEQLADPASMKQLDYAEAWLWVHFCLSTTEQRAAALRGYLQCLQSSESQESFAGRLGELAIGIHSHLDFLTGKPE